MCRSKHWPHKVCVRFYRWYCRQVGNGKGSRVRELFERGLDSRETAEYSTFQCNWLCELLKKQCSHERFQLLQNYIIIVKEIHKSKLSFWNNIIKTLKISWAFSCLYSTSVMKLTARVWHLPVAHTELLFKDTSSI